MSNSNNDNNSHLSACCVDIHMSTHVFFTCISILHMNKLNLREVKCLAQNDTTRKRSEPRLIPRPLNPKCVSFYQ